MKRTLTDLIVSAFAVIGFCAFTIFNTPPDGAGWYAAENLTIQSGKSSYTYSNSTQYHLFLGTTVPSAGNNKGQCTSELNYLCAVQFNAAGMALPTVTDDYNF